MEQNMKNNFLEIIKHFITKNFRWIILFICVVVFLSITEDVFDKEIMKYDMMGYNIISNYLINDSFTPIVKFITNLGGAFCLIIITILILITIRNKKIGFLVAINLFISTILNILLKNILQRPRPEGFRIIDEAGYSFPSGHSMISMAFYGFIIYLIYKHIKNKYLKWSLIVFLSMLIVSIGVSRIYLGVHYASDVFAGFIVAISCLILYTNVIKKYLIQERE